MKYVRVYEGDYVESEYLTTYQEHCERIANIQDCGFDFEGCIIKQADTIEELCDRYYGVDENGTVCRVYNWSKDAYPPKPHEWAVDGFCTKEDITISELKNRFPKGIFGAVVCFDSKDNLHIDIVAKMNEKGELELL